MPPKDSKEEQKVKTFTKFQSENFEMLREI